MLPPKYIRRPAPKPDQIMQTAGEQPHERTRRWMMLEESDRQIVPYTNEYGRGYLVPQHHHSRGQLIYAQTGVFMMITEQGHWMVPPDHAVWVPAQVEHAMHSHGPVSIRAIYVKAGSVPNLPASSRVVGMTDLMRSLIEEAVTLSLDSPPESRAGLIMALIREELPRLPEKPLGLTMPAEPRLSALCQDFMEHPSPHATIDDWADAMAMSRRAFTRAFRRETGLSLSAWRQQACLFAALPRLAAGEAVTSVAIDLGYDSVAAFTTMFRRILGAPPSRYLSESVP
ncbi:MAG TPA: helix-turn-helix transcriptional regulator [Candidatus Sulfotelmatobacter sp.]|nr:helix-turn-helix transcriptional regulator [Candidatus Sulfotelmatobacter sp.]